jgi:hypothetical protein
MNHHLYNIVEEESHSWVCNNGVVENSCVRRLHRNRRRMMMTTTTRIVTICLKKELQW